MNGLRPAVAVVPPVVALVPAVAVLLVVAGARGAWRRGHARRVRARALDGPPEVAVPSWFPVALARCGLTVDPQRAWPAVGALAGALLVAATFAAPPVAMVAAAGACVAWAAVPRVVRARSRRTYEADLLAAAGDLASAFAGGASLVQALTAVASRPGPLGADLRGVLARHRQGVALQGQLDAWAGSCPSPGALLLADALALVGAAGGSRAGALAGVVDTLQERAALEREVRAMAAQARASAVVLVVIPVAFASVVAVLDRRVAGFLLGTPVGWGCLAAGVALDGAGARWMVWQLDGRR